MILFIQLSIQIIGVFLQSTAVWDIVTIEITTYVMNINIAQWGDIMQQKKSSEMLQTLKQQRVLLAISIFTIVTVLLLINNYQLLPSSNESGRYAQLLGIALALFVGIIAYFNITLAKRKQAQLLDTQQQTHAISK